MAVDDHAINSLRTWFIIAYDDLKNEWKSGRYDVISDCPSYEGANAYREAMNILIKACYLPEYADKFKINPLGEMIEQELETENFWKERS